MKFPTPWRLWARRSPPITCACSRAIPRASLRCSTVMMPGAKRRRAVSRSLSKPGSSGELLFCRKAAAAGLESVFEAGLLGRAAFLPKGEDPDTFVRSRGKEALEVVLDQAVP